MARHSRSLPMARGKEGAPPGAPPPHCKPRQGRRAGSHEVAPDAGTGMSLLVSYSTMLCASCASPVPEGGRFCTNCGADVPDPLSAGPPSLDAGGVATLTRLLRQETAGEYEIEREIGRGGMGIVSLATEIQLRRRVAIKVLPPTRAPGQRAVRRFQREARTAAALDHPNIIPI